jgi:hypothetical protein
MFGPTGGATWDTPTDVPTTKERNRIDDGRRPGYAEVQLVSVTTGTQGKVELVPPHAIHAEQGGPVRSVAVILRSQGLGEGTLLQRTYDPEAKTVVERYGPTQIPYELRAWRSRRARTAIAKSPWTEKWTLLLWWAFWVASAAPLESAAQESAPEFKRSRSFFNMTSIRALLPPQEPWHLRTAEHYRSEHAGRRQPSKLQYLDKGAPRQGSVAIAFNPGTRWLIATVPVFVICYMRIEGRERWSLTVPVAPATTLFTYGSFDRVLAIPWPQTLLGMALTARKVVPGV